MKTINLSNLKKHEELKPLFKESCNVLFKESCKDYNENCKFCEYYDKSLCLGYAKIASIKPPEINPIDYEWNLPKIEIPIICHGGYERILILPLYFIGQFHLWETERDVIEEWEEFKRRFL